MDNCAVFNLGAKMGEEYLQGRNQNRDNASFFSASGMPVS